MSFVFGVLVGVALGVVLSKIRWRKRRKPAPTYGHPWSPVAALRERLPKPPASHQWEIRVQHNDRGCPLMYLSLLSLISGGSVAENEVDLIHHGCSPWDNWAQLYNNWSQRSERRAKFNIGLINPMVEWAQAQTARISNSNEPVEYWIGVR